MYAAGPKEKQRFRHPLTDAVFHLTSCESFNLCARFKTLLGLPGQLCHGVFSLIRLNVFHCILNSSLLYIDASHGVVWLLTISQILLQCS